MSPLNKSGWLELKPSSLNLTGIDGNSPGEGGITFISRRQTDTFFSFSLVFDYTPNVVGEEAGISLFLSQNHHARMGITLLPLAEDSTVLEPHFVFHAISNIPVPNDVRVPIPEKWRGKLLTLYLHTVNQTHYEFLAGPSDGLEDPIQVAIVSGQLISWGFTGALLGAYATLNQDPSSSVGGNHGSSAYVKNWYYKVTSFG